MQEVGNGNLDVMLVKPTCELCLVPWVLWACHELQIASFLGLETLTSKSAVASLWELSMAVYIFSSFWSGLQFELKLQVSLLKISWDLWAFALFEKYGPKVYFWWDWKSWRCQPWHRKLFSAIFNFLNSSQHVNPAARWSWSDLSNWNSLTFLHNYSYKILLNAEKMVVFKFFYKG